MPVNVSQQTIVFFACVLTGILSGVIGDILNVTAQKLRFNKSAVFVKDILLWMIVLAFFFSVIYRINGAVIRWYVFLGLFFGMLIYLLAFRCTAVKIIAGAIGGLVAVIGKILRIILVPVKKMARLLKPIKKYVQNTLKKNKKFVQKNIEKMRRIKILLNKI